MKKYLLPLMLLTLLLVACSKDDDKKEPKSDYDRPIKTYTINGVSFNMCTVEGGSYMMGALDSEKDASNIEKPSHKVTLSTFAIGETEVTQDLWEVVMGNNPSKYKSKKYPVENVSWDDCQRFITKLNSLTGKNFRLPTEAEWEFAARGGNKSQGYKYPGSDNLDEVAWYIKTTKATGFFSHNEVANKAPNELGIYDMLGNVFEWCNDYYSGKYYKTSPENNPPGPDGPYEYNGKTYYYRVTRGFGWWTDEMYMHIWYRGYEEQDTYNEFIGLRLAL